MNKAKSKSFCVQPWLHSYVNSNGAYQVCCTADEYHSGIPDKNGVDYNIKNRPDIDEVMNSEFMKKLRKEMMSGEWNRICTRCFETEEHGGVSRRMLENAQHSEKISGLIEKTKDDGEIELELKSLDYRLGNFCNLQCRMCGPFSTGNWIKDWNEVMPSQIHLSNEQKEYYLNFDWVEQELLIDEFREKVKGIDQIHFAGGEPLLAPQMSKILRECINLGLAKNISVSYNTNITVLPKEVLKLWKEFKEIKLLCSVDGFNEVNEYIRFPSKWKTIDTNLHFLDEHADEFHITEILLSCTVQIYNVLSLGELYSYLRQFKKIVPALNLINLNFPEYMSTKVLPDEAKLEASKRLNTIAEELKNRIPQNYTYLLENIFQVINFMNAEDHTTQLMKFKTVNTKIDKLKKFKLSESLPDLNGYLIEYYLKRVSESE